MGKETESAFRILCDRFEMYLSDLNERAPGYSMVQDSHGIVSGAASRAVRWLDRETLMEIVLEHPGKTDACLKEICFHDREQFDKVLNEEGLTGVFRVIVAEMLRSETFPLRVEMDDRREEQCESDDCEEEESSSLKT